VSKQTIYAWKARYCGMDLSEAEDGHQLLQRGVLFPKILDKEMLQSVIRHSSLGS
jgi:hypothetical protein